MLGPYRVLALTPDDFVVRLMETSETALATAIDHRAALRRPPFSAMEYTSAIRHNGLPMTAHALGRLPL